MALNQITFSTTNENTTDDWKFLSEKVVEFNVQSYYPGKQEITLKNGDFVSFSPNEKYQITASFAFITKDEMQLLLKEVNSVFTINTSQATAELPTKLQFGNKKFLIQGTNLDYSFADRYLTAGFSGTITFIETTN